MEALVFNFWMRLGFPWRVLHFRVRSEIHRSLIRAGFWLAAIVVLHVIAMNRLEGMSWGDALWLTLTTATTVGYGDMAATTPLGRFMTDQSVDIVIPTKVRLAVVASRRDQCMPDRRRYLRGIVELQPRLTQLGRMHEFQVHGVHRFAIPFACANGAADQSGTTPP